MRSRVGMLIVIAAFLASAPAASAAQFVIETGAPQTAQRAAALVDGQVKASLPQIGAYLITAPAGSLPQLRVAPGVRASDTNSLNRLDGLPITDPLASREWYLARVQVGFAWGETLGDPSVKIAVIDSGVDYRNPELAGKVILGPDIAQGDDDPMDTIGHGTAVASVAAAADDGSGMVGLCPHCSILAIKVVPDGSNSTSKFNTAQGIVWATDHGASVINLSLGGPDDDPVERDATAYAIAHGVVVVAAAGNDGTSDMHFPAAYPGVIAVASTTDDDSLAFSSSFGPWVDIAAPGTQMLVAGLDNAYARVNGTSFASPVVAGIAGLLRSRVPTLSTDAVANDLVAGAEPLTAPSPGRANAARAMRLALGEPLEPEPRTALTFVSFGLDGTPARAGHALTANATVMSSETGELLQEGDIICEAYAGQRRVRLAKADFASGVATCRWDLPSFVAGKKLHAFFEVVSNGASAARHFTLPIHKPSR